MQFAEVLDVQCLYILTRLWVVRYKDYLTGEEAAWEIMWFTLGLLRGKELTHFLLCLFSFLLYLAILQGYCQFVEIFS